MITTLSIFAESLVRLILPKSIADEREHQQYGIQAAVSAPSKNTATAWR